jgi:hypothetical protein
VRSAAPLAALGRDRLGVEDWDVERPAADAAVLSHRVLSSYAIFGDIIPPCGGVNDEIQMTNVECAEGINR